MLVSFEIYSKWKFRFFLADARDDPSRFKPSFSSSGLRSVSKLLSLCLSILISILFFYCKLKKSEITFSTASKFKKICDDIGIEFFCSAFYPEAVNFLKSINVKRYKIASRTCLLKDPYSLETLQEKALTKKPVIISMGMGGNRKKIENIFSKNQKIFCYCISEYPTDMSKIDWKDAIKFDGFSDHTLGIIASIIFAVLKKQQKSKNILIEKHVKLNNSRGPDASSSIDTEELSELVKKIHQIEKL